MAPATAKAPRVSDAVFISVDELFLDERNPRLLGEGAGSPQDRILETLWREFAVDEVALSIAANGFFPFEPLFAVRESNRWVVIEGNRRLAAVKLLLDPTLRAQVRASDLPTITAAQKRALQELPVVKCDRGQVWQFLGFKHVNGAQPWDSMSKAEYVAWVHNTLNVSLADVAKQIGDKHSTVIRLYTGLMALQQVESAGFWNRADRWSKRFYFSHLYTGLTLDGIRKYVGVSGSRERTSDNPVPTAKLRNLAEVCVWMYGSRESGAPPLVQTQNPDLRKLDEIVATKDGVSALRRGLPLQVSLDITRGDERILRETLVQAKSILQDAYSRVPTGYHGESDIRRAAEDILTLADSLIEAMERYESPRRSRGTARKR